MGRIYQERSCAFIDFLGFKELVKNKNPEDIYKIIWELSDFNQAGRKDLSGDMEYQAFSDNIFINTPSTSEGLIALIGQVRWLTLTALEKGAFIRGGITIGNISQNEQNNILFGPALIEAYELESKIALYPRIILSKSAVSLLKESNKDQIIEQQICQSQDGVWYIHLFNDSLQDVYDDWQKTFKPIIEQALKENIDNPNVFKKIRWFAEYYNHTISEEFDHLVGIYQLAKTGNPVDTSKLISLPGWP